MSPLKRPYAHPCLWAVQCSASCGCQSAQRMPHELDIQGSTADISWQSQMMWSQMTMIQHQYHVPPLRSLCMTLLGHTEAVNHSCSTALTQRLANAIGAAACRAGL